MEKKRVLTRMEVGTERLHAGTGCQRVPTSRICPSAGASGTFRRCCSVHVTNRLLSEFALLAHSQRRLRGITRLRVCVKIKAKKVADSCLFPSTTYSGLRLTEFSAAFPKRTKWIFALGRPSPRFS